MKRGRRARPAIDRFMERVGKPASPLDCWEWRGSDPYSWTVTAGQGVSPRRFAYAYFWGEVPEDLSVAPLCCNPRCVNPLHLKAMPRRRAFWYTSPTDNWAQSINANAEESGREPPFPFEVLVADPLLLDAMQRRGYERLWRSVAGK